MTRNLHSVFKFLTPFICVISALGGWGCRNALDAIQGKRYDFLLSLMFAIPVIVVVWFASAAVVLFVNIEGERRVLLVLLPLVSFVCGILLYFAPMF